jgi:enterobactin synthetase component D
MSALVVVAQFRRLPPPALFAVLGAAHSVSLDDVHFSDGADDVETCGFAPPASLERSVTKRIRSYLAGRHCAATALRHLSPERFAMQVEPLPTGARGAPVWPEGIVGSIAHSRDRAVAVAARTDVVASVGIDCERLLSASVALEIERRVFSEARDLHAITSATGLAHSEIVSAVFAAKEAIYKCLSPRLDRFIEFEAATLIAWDVSRGVLQFEMDAGIERDLGLRGAPISVTYSVSDDHIFTVATLSH